MQKKRNATGFNFSKIVIIESLKPSDSKTGKLLKTHLDQFSYDEGWSLLVEYTCCQTRLDVINTLCRLILGAKEMGEIPILHFECHGNSRLGLICADDSLVDWEVLNSHLTSLNEATGFNLLAVFSACHGGHFLKNLSPLRPCPCWAMVGPTDVIDESDSMGGFRSFYRSVIKTRDIGLAALALKGHALSKGRWLVQHSEVWFEDVVKNYIVKLCNKNSTRKRTKNLYRRSIAEGRRASIGSLKRNLKRTNRKNLSGEFFDSYFMLEKIPNNKIRFAEARARMVKIIKELAATGKYSI